MKIPGFTANAAATEVGAHDRRTAPSLPLLSSGGRGAVIPQRIRPPMRCIGWGYDRCCCPLGTIIVTNPCQCISAEY
jgi:hypothetical protein